jgi:two-component system sensor histidine kinase ChvG
VRADKDFRIASSTEDRPKRRTALLSPLTRRILAVNLVAPVLLALGLLFLDEYEDSLIGTALDGLRTDAELIAAAIGEGAVVMETDSGTFGPFMPAGATRRIDDPTAQQLVRRLAELAEIRARLYDRGGAMIADSRLLRGPGGEVRVVDLPVTDTISPTEVYLRAALAWIESILRADDVLDPYVDQSNGTAYDYSEVVNALERGDAGGNFTNRSSARFWYPAMMPQWKRDCLRSAVQF